MEAEVKDLEAQDLRAVEEAQEGKPPPPIPLCAPTDDEQERNYVKSDSYVRYGNDKRSLEVLSEGEALKRSPPELWEELKKRMLDTYPARIDSCVKLYEETHNPLYLWKAIGYSMTVDIPLPAAVRNYLVECANNLLGGFECKRALKLNECGNESMLERMNRRGVEIDKVTAYSNRLPGFETQERSARTLGIGARWFSKIINKHKRS